MIRSIRDTCWTPLMLTGCWFFGGTLAWGQSAPPATDAPSGFAVVELFTSEGCSSCPAADDVLAGLAADAVKTKRPVITLAFHVDYWNHLGHPDRFSAAPFTARQRAYVAAMSLQSAYAPQMIVNGKAEFVGSDRRRAEREIEAALEAPAAAKVEIKSAKVVRSPDDPKRSAAAGDAASPAIEVELSVTGAPRDAKLCVAIVQNELATDVKRGENAGRKLKHERVVRVFDDAQLGASSSAKRTLRLPADAKAESCRAVAFVQDPNTLRIVAAAETVIEPPPSGQKP